MDELEVVQESSEIVPYERGISVSQVLRGAFARFLPASLISTGIGFAVAFGGSFESLVSIVPRVVLTMTLGFALGLVVMRRWLFPDAEVAGRKSAIAGLVSPLAAFFIGVSRITGFGALRISRVVLASIGVVLAVLMFFAWLSPTPEEMRPSRFRTWSSDEEGPQLREMIESQ